MKVTFNPCDLGIVGCWDREHWSRSSLTTNRSTIWREHCRIDFSWVLIPRILQKLGLKLWSLSNLRERERHHHFLKHMCVSFGCSQRSNLSTYEGAPLEHRGFSLFFPGELNDLRCSHHEQWLDENKVTVMGEHPQNCSRIDNFFRTFGDLQEKVGWDRTELRMWFAVRC